MPSRASKTAARGKSAEKQRCELTKSPQKRKAADAQAESVRASLPEGLSRPALRALAEAGITNFDQLAKAGEARLGALPGRGKEGIDTIRAALKKAGKSLRS